MQLHRAITGAIRSLQRAFPRALAGAIACAGAVGVCGPAWTQTLDPEPVANLVLQAPLDTAIGLHASGDVGKVVVSQPETAQVGQAGDGLYLIGSQAGATNLLVYDRKGRLAQSIDINVGPDAHALRDLLADALPAERISVTALSSSVILDGEVSSPSVQRIAESLAERIAPDSVISRLQARQNQVLLEVRIMEVSRRSLDEISTAVEINNGAELSVALGAGGIGAEAPQGTGRIRGGSGRVSIDATVRALEDEGQLRVVAQPSLVALSGETASFHSGGEFPFPVPGDDNQITIQFRPYGAAMTFSPVVQENGLIRVALSTELSDIDPTVAIRLGGLTVPGLKVRRATTITELRDGEAFLIAGLFETADARTVREPPFLARTPVVGRLLAPLFRAGRTQTAQRELAIVVTPHLGREAASPLGDQSLLAESKALPVPPSAQARPSRPTLRTLLSEVKESLRPPVRWAKQVATRFANALLNRA